MKMVGELASMLSVSIRRRSGWYRPKSSNNLHRAYRRPVPLHARHPGCRPRSYGLDRHQSPDKICAYYLRMTGRIRRLGWSGPWKTWL
jgi:hypothetical protein